MHLHSLFLHYVSIWPLGYLLAFWAMVLEGDGPLFIFGFLIYQGYLSMLWGPVVLYVGTVVGDVLWYQLGVHAVRYPRIARWSNKLASPFDRQLREHPFRTLLISKFVYGIHHALWVRAGTLGLPLRKLALFDMIATLPWLLIVGGLGYASSASLLPLGHYLRSVELLLLIGLVAFFVIQRLVSGWSAKRL